MVQGNFNRKFQGVKSIPSGYGIAKGFQWKANRNEIIIKLFQARDKFKKALELGFNLYFTDGTI
jgi:hypothetical protein